jgi:hypothetical protein
LRFPAKGVIVYLYAFVPNRPGNLISLASPPPRSRPMTWWREAISKPVLDFAWGAVLEQTGRYHQHGRCKAMRFDGAARVSLKRRRSIPLE